VVGLMRGLRDLLAKSGAFNSTKPDMEPILDTTSGWARCSTLGKRAAVILALFIGLATVQADTMGFMDAFAPANWNPTIFGGGSAYFTNSDTELDLVGPTATPTGGGSSIDGMLYNGPLSGGLVVGGTMQFHWEYVNYGDTVSPSGGEIDWTPPGGGGTMQALLGQEGISESGNFSTNLVAGTPFSFNLTATFPAGVTNKLSATLIITGFQFHDVPEPSTGTLLASMLAFLGAARGRRARIQARGLCQAFSTY
jgi:hypothetical protein